MCNYLEGREGALRSDAGFEAIGILPLRFMAFSDFRGSVYARSVVTECGIGCALPILKSKLLCAHETETPGHQVAPTLNIGDDKRAFIGAVNGSLTRRAGLPARFPVAHQRREMSLRLRLIYSAGSSKDPPAINRYDKTIK
ncbi:unnamed protein product, partial [Iphiclides podalirius]